MVLDFIISADDIPFWKNFLLELMVKTSLDILPNWKKNSEDKPQFFCWLLHHQKSIPNSHHTRVKISSRYESCLLTNRNTAALLPHDIYFVLRQSVDANLVIGSPCQYIFPKWKNIQKYRGVVASWYIGCLKAKCWWKLGNWESMSGMLLWEFFQNGNISRYVTLIPLRNSSYNH